MSKHTPGPWWFLVEKDDPTVVYIETSEDNIAAVVRSSADLSLADALLIAAAPDMLEALEIMVRAFEEPSNIDPLVAFAAIERAKQAIAKAKGQQL